MPAARSVFGCCTQETPKFYIRVLADLEKAVKKLTRSDTKKMSRTNATGCVALPALPPCAQGAAAEFARAPCHSLPPGTTARSRP